MNKKKPAPNWEEIKTRYILKGEPPRCIAQDYNVAAQTISNRASQENWRKERVEIGKELREEETERRKRLISKTGQALEMMVSELIHEAKQRGAYNQEIPDKVHFKAWELALKHYFKSVSEDRLEFDAIQWPFFD